MARNTGRKTWTKPTLPTKDVSKNKIPEPFRDAATRCAWLAIMWIALGVISLIMGIAFDSEATRIMAVVQMTASSPFVAAYIVVIALARRFDPLRWTSGTATNTTISYNVVNPVPVTPPQTYINPGTVQWGNYGQPTSKPQEPTDD